MIAAYCSSTGTRTTIAALKRYGWRILVVASSSHRNHGMPYAIDNGAWAAHCRGESFDDARFRKILKWSSTQEIKPDWIVLPDIVAGGLESLEFSRRWIDEVSEYTTRPLLAVQDGMTPKDVEPLMREGMGIFLGGSTEWKLKTMHSWGQFCHQRFYFHVARVNSFKRMAQARGCGADSFDGTRAVRWPTDDLPVLDRFRHQLTLAEYGDIVTG